MSRPRYEHVEASAETDDLVFTVPPEYIGKAIEVAFSEGGRFKRVRNVATLGSSTFFKLVGQADDTATAQRARDAADARRKRPMSFVVRKGDLFLRCYRGGRFDWKPGEELATTFHSFGDAVARAEKLKLDAREIAVEPKQ